MTPLLASLTALAAAASTTHAGEIRTFRDWTVGCDNGLRCEAVALLPDTMKWEEWITMSLSREAHGDAPPELTIHDIETAPRALLVDGERLAARFVGDEDGFRIEAERPAELVRTIRNGRALEVQDARGATLGRVSLTGAAAAMLYMDEAQRRVGTRTALAGDGNLPPSSVPAPPSLPRVRLAPAPTDDAIALSEARVDALRRESGCTLDEVGGPEYVETQPIAPERTLVLLACGSGAYNLISVPFIAQRSGDQVEIEIAPFDIQRGVEQGNPVLINPSWDAEHRLLREYDKGRGIGDCGTRAHYGWDGERFRLVHLEEMGECRGSAHYIRTWSAEVDRP